MTPHPRLLASSFQLRRLRNPAKLPLLRKMERLVASDAAKFLRSEKLTYDPGLHNALLSRSREMQRRVLTLLVRWHQTGADIYRVAALKSVWAMGNWEYWGWDRWREQNRNPESDFDLSYGENSATLALAYDWLFASLSASEHERFRQIASRWSLRPFLAQVKKDKGVWWFGHPRSNWNAVCAGGAGMLALAMYEDNPEAGEVLEYAETSIAAYVKSLDATKGGWCEGIGYWNYGHRYAFWYLLSHESATGCTHPLLRMKGVRETLDFPLDFCPNGQPCSFGDVNSWSPLPFHYAASLRLGRKDLLGQLDKLFVAGDPELSGPWPNAAELLVFHPRKSTSLSIGSRMVRKMYPKLDWGILADRFPDPNLYLSIRGGSVGPEVPHCHLDLLSFHCVVGSERLIDNLGINGGDGYLDTTFGSRRFEIFETTPASKNTLLLNGVGINGTSAVESMPLTGQGLKGFRLNATNAIRWDEPEAVRFCGRLFLLLEERVALIVDRVVLKHAGRMEARFHTFSQVRMEKDRAVIQGQRECLQLVCDATVPSTMHGAEDALTTPGLRSTMIRWCTDDRTQTEVVFGTLLAPGKIGARLALQKFPKYIEARIQRGTVIRTFRIAPSLKRIVRVKNRA